MTKIFAHRGLTTTGLQENTVKAISAAFETGVDGVEFDVHRTKDDVWILHHDFDFYHQNITIPMHRFDDLKEIADTHTKTLDTLDRVLDRFSSKILNIECKSRSRQDGILLGQFLKDRDYVTQGVISSFSDETLRGLRSISSDFHLGLLGKYITTIVWLKLNWELDLYSVNPYQEFARWGIRKLTQLAGLELHPWVANDNETIERLLKLGSDVIITDIPKLAMKIRSHFQSRKTRN